MERKVTIQDVAALAGVAKSTVSRYLNDGYISEQTARKIQIAIRETGFRTNFFASRIRRRSTKLLGIVMPRLDSYTGGSMLSGMGKAMEDAGYQSLLQVSHLSAEQELSRIRQLCNQGMDGIVVVSVGITQEHVRLVEELDVPVLFVGQQHPRVRYLKVDDYAAGRMMGQVIRESGHKRVVFAGVGEKDRALGVERRDGFEEVFSRGNRGASVSFVEMGFGFRAAYDAGEEIMCHRPTAIVCATDNMGLGILRYLHEQGIDVPGDVSVAGFGGYDVASITYPALTTIAFDYEELGKAAVETMLQQLAGEAVESRANFPIQLMLRESVRSVKEDEK